MYSYRNKNLKYKTVIFLLVFSFFSGGSIKAQQDDFGWRISAGYGYTNYYGDLSSYTIARKNAYNIFNLFHLNTGKINVSNLNNSMLNSYSFSVERKWTNTIGIIAQYSHNTIYGNDRTDLNGNLDPSNENFARALNFKSDLNNISLGFVFRADNDHILRSTSFLAPYLTLVAGYTFFNPKADLYDAIGIPYNYMPDGTIPGGIIPDGVYETSLQPLMTESEEYKPRTFNAGLGLGIRFRITSRFGIHAESVLHYTFSDHLDDVGGDYPSGYQSFEQQYASNPTGVIRTTRGSSASNDIFMYHSLSLRFSFGATKKTQYQAPVFNSNSYLNPLEQTDIEIIRDPAALALNTVQDSSEQFAGEASDIDRVAEAEVKEDITSTKGKDYEIRILKRDAANSKTNIKIENGRIAEISIENSDVFIDGYHKENESLPTPSADSIRFIMPITKTITPESQIQDTTERLTFKDTLDIQNLLGDQFDETLTGITWDNEIFQAKMDSLIKVNEDQKEYFLQKIMEMESRVPEQPVTKVVQPEKEKPQLEQVEQKTDTITKEAQAPQEDTRRLSMQIDTMNKVLNEKLIQLEEQQRESQTKADQKTIDYMESLRRIQEVDTVRSNQPEMDSLMKEEFRKLSLQIQEYENERMIKAMPEVADTVIDTENINLKDSIRRLQSELQEIKDQPAEVITRIIEKPVESIKVVKTIDIESIPVVDVFFELGSAVVSASEEAKIRNTAQLLTDYPESKVILTGMADATGNSDRNLALSLRRAEYVRDLLVQKYAIDSDRIKVDSIGASLSEGKSVFDRKVSMKMVLSF